MKPTALLFAAVLATAAVPALAQSTVPAASVTTPAERFEVGVLAVERHGAATGVPLILVPGLASGAWAWRDFVRRFGASHPLYVVTLPGFDGRAAVPGPVLPQVGTALRRLIVERKLERPVLIGHSLGATVSIALAETDAALLRGVVAVDGLAVMPGSENTPPAMRGAMAASIQARMASASGAAFAASQQSYMRAIGVIDMARADQLAVLSARSDPQAVTAIMGEVLEQDLRASLPGISVPVLLVAPYFEADGVQRGISEAMVKDYYASLMAGTPKLTVTTIAPSRHFVMVDQPERLAETIAAFIAPLR